MSCNSKNKTKKSQPFSKTALEILRREITQEVEIEEDGKGSSSSDILYESKKKFKSELNCFIYYQSTFFFQL